MPPTPRPDSSREFLALQNAVKGRYSLERELGRGGMGVVFLARDVALDRLVAIKLLPPDLAHREDLRALFLREARTAARLSHPNIVPIHAVEEQGDLVFFVMTYVDGETLGARVRRGGPLPAAEVMRVTQEVAWALAHAHAHGVVHRDVKPDNILLERDTGRALVTDFGIARVVQSLDPAGGAPTGTPQYMSPEQARGEAVDGRSDLYSLGVTAYFAAAGRLPFESWSPHTLLMMHAEQTPPPVRAAAPRLPGDFAGAVDRLLAKAPGDRFESGDALAAAIGEARGAVGTVPAAVRRYVQTAERIGGEVAPLAITAGSVIAGFEVMKLFAGDFLGIATSIEFVLAAALLGVAGARAAQLVSETRRLIGDGYRHDAVRAAAVIADREHDAQQSAEPLSRVGLRTWLAAAGGLALTTLGFYMMLNFNHSGLDVLGFLVGITTPAITARRVWRDLEAGKSGTWWNRLMAGRFGGKLFELLGRTVKTQAVAPSAEPTAVLLARATEDLYHGLPGEMRRQLAEVPALLARLQADAAGLRALDPADPARASRLSATITALENLRLDLLRLHAGQAVPDELTADLERARELGRRVDALAEVRDPTPA